MRPEDWIALGGFSVWALVLLVILIRRICRKAPQPPVPQEPAVRIEITVGAISQK